MSSTQEEADTFFIINALHITSTGSEIQIMSLDTMCSCWPFADIHNWVNILHLSQVLTPKDAQSSSPQYTMPLDSTVGDNIAAALPGFHTFIGCDTNGRFKGTVKLWCWTALKQSIDDVLEAWYLCSSLGSCHFTRDGNSTCEICLLALRT